ncbi:hypothetical protein HG536_0G03170 [Torulaspora globosa]|uniref:Uncharacterized protein n=1 Tax=Torulaspora globosa TaxID=48254 RepID=A0A7G3ZLR9_9SACH|nr:uncharacterized protein HG536_0G03170 [Torulaspora globosa]QLL34455.1 hypothetical protein HG536_0G03170 [Torulaspora globosa]
MVTLQGTASASETPSFSATLPAHNNKLTQCFDDIMKVAAEMMVQQQLKTVQLDTSVINGFSEAQQRVLSEKVHLFHSILDDLETTLSKSKSYIGAIYEIAVEKEKERERKRIDQRRKQEEEEQRKNRELEELKSRQLSGQSIEDNRIESENRTEFSRDRTNGMLVANLGDDRRNINGSPNMVMSAQSQIAMTPGDSQQQSPRNSQGQPTQGDDMGEIGNMDISMFPGLDNTGFDIGSFGTGINGSEKNGDKSTEPINTFEKPSGTTDNNLSENPEAGYMADNGENYLTLNDFNDLNIDWAANGDNGDLDLNGFNI